MEKAPLKDLAPGQEDSAQNHATPHAPLYSHPPGKIQTPTPHAQDNTHHQHLEELMIMKSKVIQTSSQTQIHTNVGPPDHPQLDQDPHIEVE